MRENIGRAQYIERVQDRDIGKGRRESTVQIQRRSTVTEGE